MVSSTILEYIVISESLATKCNSYYLVVAASCIILGENCCNIDVEKTWKATIDVSGIPNGKPWVFHLYVSLQEGMMYYGGRGRRVVDVELTLGDELTSG